MQNLIYFLVKDHEVHAEGNIVGPLLFHHNDTTYKGHMLDGKKQGFGTEVYTDGSFYIGAFE